MKIFIICCLLFIHVNICIFIRGFRVSIRVSGIHGFGFGDGFPPESVLGFDFGFRFWVHGDFTRSEPDPLPSLRLRLDVDIGKLGIELGSMPKQSSIGNGLQYQIHCLDVDKIIRWNLER